MPIYDRAIAMGTVPYEVWMQAATAHLVIDDEEGFRRVCETMRVRHSEQIFEGLVASTLADVAILGPGGLGDDGKVMGWVEPLLAAVGPSRKALRREILQTLGAILYRAGRYHDAIARLEDAKALGEGKVERELAVFLALAHFRTGERSKASALLASPSGDEPDGPSAEDWWAARGRHLLRREAAAEF